MLTAVCKLFTYKSSVINASEIKCLRNYVKGVQKNNAVVSVKKMYTFLFSVEKYKFDIPK